MTPPEPPSSVDRMKTIGKEVKSFAAHNVPTERRPVKEFESNTLADGISVPISGLNSAFHSGF